MSTHWIKRTRDPYLRKVSSSELVFFMSGGTVFALRLDCGHTVYMSQGKQRNVYAPAHYRGSRCIKAAIGDKPIRRRLTLSEAAIEGYVSGAAIGVIDAARAAIALEGKS
jgi:hypothetical protein